jgi:hypothetical protein
MFQHLFVLWLSRTHHLCQGFQGHISAYLKYGKDYLIRLMVPVCTSFQGHVTALLVAMFVLALGYIISTLVLFGIISTLINNYEI